MNPMMDDDDDDDGIDENLLDQLSGEVDNYAGSKLGDSPDHGMSVTITVSPNGQGMSLSGEPKLDPMDEKEGEPDDHDPIAHILGMHAGGCAY